MTTTIHLARVIDEFRGAVHRHVRVRPESPELPPKTVDKPIEGKIMENN